MEALVEKLRSGSISEEEKGILAEAHIKWAISIAKRYAKNTPHKLELFKAEGMYGIAYALANAKERMTDNNFTGYCISCIKSKISKCFHEDMVIRVPHVMLTTGKEKRIPTVSLIQTFSQTSEEGRSPRQIQKMFEAFSKEDFNLIEIKEELSTIVKTPVEAKIICLRAEGFKDEEIAVQLGVSRSFVIRTKEELYSRFIGR